jgi:hypothetical protein
MDDEIPSTPTDVNPKAAQTPPPDTDDLQFPVLVQNLLVPDQGKIQDITASIVHHPAPIEDKIVAICKVARVADNSLADIEQQIRELSMKKGQLENRSEILRDAAEQCFVSTMLIGEKMPGIQWRKSAEKVELKSTFNHDTFRQQHPDCYKEIHEFQPDVKRIKEIILENHAAGIEQAGTEIIPEKKKLYLK